MDVRPLFFTKHLFAGLRNAGEGAGTCSKGLNLGTEAMQYRKIEIAKRLAIEALRRIGLVLAMFETATS